jgi:hypothetical protein
MHYLSSISIKDFVREKKSATEKRKSNRNFLLMKFNTKPLKFKYGLDDRGGGGAGWQTHARHGYPHLVFNNKKIVHSINSLKTLQKPSFNKYIKADSQIILKLTCFSGMKYI